MACRRHTECLTQIADDDDVNEIDDQDQHERRNIDTTEIRQQLADGPQCRFGDSVKEFADHRDDRTARVYDVEHDQPTQHRLGDENENVKIQKHLYKIKQSEHRSKSRFVGAPNIYRSPANSARASKPARAGGTRI